jgi:hypothetical protein
MKKTLITLAVAIAAISSYAQGFVLFQNAGNTRVSTNSVVGGAGTGRISANDGTVANTFYFALFISTSQSATVGGSSNGVVGASGTYAFNAAGWAFDNPSATAGYVGPAYGTNNAAAGQFQSTVADPNNSLQTLLASSAAQTFTIIGWSANIGNSIAALQSYLANPTFNAFVGESAVSGATAPSTGGASPTVAITGTTYPAIPGFTLGLVTPVPEPGTMALAALSGASLLLFRRRK